MPARRVMTAVLCVTIAGAAETSPATAQTPVSALGLGVPVPSIDARAAALGGTGLGFATGSVSARNPADIALYGQPVLGITYAPEGVTVKASERDASTGRSRVSVLRGAIPFGEWAAGVAFAAELDQDWQASFIDTLFVDAGTFPFAEQRTQDGGLSSVNLTLARRLGTVSVGAEYAIMTGRLQQTYRRDFESDIDDPSRTLTPSAALTDWEYAGSRFKVGAAAELADGVHVGADVSLQGTLTAERDSIGGEARTRKYDMPAALEIGASAQVTERLMVTGAGGWTGWSGAEGASDEFVASNVVWAGVGAELADTRVLGLSIPMRVGLRRTGLPYHLRGRDQLSETALTMGFGVRVADEQARVDVAFELGSRGDLDGSGVEESFQRLSLTLALFQN